MINTVDKAELLTRSDLKYTLENLYCDCIKPLAPYVNVRTCWLDCIGAYYDRIVSNNNNNYAKIIHHHDINNLLDEVEMCLGKEENNDFLLWLKKCTHKDRFTKYYTKWQDVMRLLHQDSSQIQIINAIDLDLLIVNYDNLIISNENIIHEKIGELYLPSFNLSDKDIMIINVEKLGYDSDTPPPVSALNNDYTDMIFYDFWKKQFQASLQSLLFRFNILLI